MNIQSQRVKKQFVIMNIGCAITHGPVGWRWSLFL